MSPPRRLAVIFDAVEERWPSMEYSAEMLLRHLQLEHADSLAAEAVRPWFFPGFEQLPLLNERRAFNLDRMATRFVTYPLQLRAAAARFELFHIADHTYAHLALVLPPGRTGIYCHDLDAFEAALEPKRQAAWRVAMSRLQLAGLRRAARVFYSTEQVRTQIVRRGIVDPARLIHAPLGVAEEFWRPAESDLPAEARGFPYLLNVAGNLPRKRLDVLFSVFARVSRAIPEVRLIQHGAELDESQERMIRELGIGDRLIRMRSISRAALAALYQGAALVLLPSEREGFGFPAAEALAAGTVVVLSDIPAFREIGGSAAVFCPVGDVDAWARRVIALLNGSEAPPDHESRQAQIRHFRWEAHAGAVAAVYTKLGAGG